MGLLVDLIITVELKDCEDKSTMTQLLSDLEDVAASQNYDIYDTAWEER